MNVLVIESDEKLSTAVVNGLKKTFNDPSVNIITAGELTTAMSLMIASGIGLIEIIICAETVEESFSDGQSSNGLRCMREYRQRGASTPIVILTDKKLTPVLNNDNGMYMIHRYTEVLEARLESAMKHFFPHLF